MYHLYVFSIGEHLMLFYVSSIYVFSVSSICVLYSFLYIVLYRRAPAHSVSSIYVPARFCRDLSRARARALCRTHHSVSRSSAPSRASCSCFSSAALSRASCVCGMCEMGEVCAREAQGAIVRERERDRALCLPLVCLCVCVRARSLSPVHPTCAACGR